MQWSVITWRSANPIQDTGGTTGVLGVMGYAISLRILVVPRRPYIRCSVGRCLRRCRGLHRASARHSRMVEGITLSLSWKEMYHLQHRTAGRRRYRGVIAYRCQTPMYSTPG